MYLISVRYGIIDTLSEAQNMLHSKRTDQICCTLHM